MKVVHKWLRHRCDPHKDIKLPDDIEGCVVVWDWSGDYGVVEKVNIKKIIVWDSSGKTREIRKTKIMGVYEKV
jgi:hypothetical protein